MVTIEEITRQPSDAEIRQRKELLALQEKGELNLITAMSILGTADTNEGAEMIQIIQQIHQSFVEDPVLQLDS